MTEPVPAPRRRPRLMLPLLAALFAGSVALFVWSAFAVQDVEDDCARAETRQRVGAVVRAHVLRKRQRNAVPLRGALVAAPTDQRQVRAMVEFCDTASAAEIPALRDVALHAADALAAGNAVRALGRLHAVTTDAALLELLDDPRVRVRDEMILALGESRDGAALDRLEPLLRTGDEHVRLLALRAIGRVGGERGRRILAQVAADPGGSRETSAFARAGLAVAER